jgi:hypothetical protein
VSSFFSSKIQILCNKSYLIFNFTISYYFSLKMNHLKNTQQLKVEGEIKVQIENHFKDNSII